MSNKEFRKSNFEGDFESTNDFLPPAFTNDQ